MRPSRLLIAGLALLTSVSLSSCGFSPMYGTNGVSAGLSDLRIETGQEREDFLLQEALHDRLGSRHADGPYTLIAETDLLSLGLGVGADAVAARFAVRINVTYQIVLNGHDTPVVTGSAHGEASYNANSQVFGQLSAQRDAEERAADMAARQMSIQIARAFQDQDTW